MAKHQWNSLIISEQKQIFIEYELCRLVLGVCVDKLRTKIFNINELKYPASPLKNELILHRITLDRNDLKDFGLYEMKYRIFVTDSPYITHPKTQSQKLQIQYLPYL